MGCSSLEFIVSRRCLGCMVPALYITIAMNEIVQFSCIALYIAFSLCNGSTPMEWMFLALAAITNLARMGFSLASHCPFNGRWRWLPGDKIEHVFNACCVLFAGTATAFIWDLYQSRLNHIEVHLFRRNLSICVVSVGASLSMVVQLFKMQYIEEHRNISRSRAGPLTMTLAGRSLPSSKMQPTVVSFELDEETAATLDVARSPCVICLGEVVPGCPVGRLPCGHLFHDDCIGQWLKHGPRCPMRCSATKIEDISAQVDRFEAT